MKEFLKKYWWILLVIALLIAAYFIWKWMTNKKDITFDFAISGDANSILNGLTGSSARSSEKGMGIYLDVPITTIIKNNSTSAIILKNIMGSISYNNQSILQTKSDSPVLNSVDVAAKSSRSVTDSIQVLINPSSIKFFSEFVKGNKPAVNYKMNTTIFGVPYQVSKQTTINKL